MAPKVSIITVCYNAADVLEESLQSILSQTYENKELVVIDGGSKDRSQDVFAKYKHGITTLVSEKDKGIYDAMNKGVRYAAGDYVIFMNAGDCFSADDVLSRVFSAIPSQEQAWPDVIYGDHVIFYPELALRRHGQAKSLSEIRKGMIFCHQSVFVKRQCHLQSPFVLNDLAADYLFFLRMHFEGKHFLHVPVDVATVTAGGVSDRKRGQVLRSYWRANRELGGFSFPLTCFYAFRLMTEPAKAFVLNHLPETYRSGLLSRLRKAKVTQAGQ